MTRRKGGELWGEEVVESYWNFFANSILHPEKTGKGCSMGNILALGIYMREKLHPGSRVKLREFKDTRTFLRKQ